MLAAGHLIALHPFTEKSEEVWCLNQDVLFLLPSHLSWGNLGLPGHEPLPALFSCYAGGEIYIITQTNPVGALVDHVQGACLSCLWPSRWLLWSPQLLILELR